MTFNFNTRNIPSLLSYDAARAHHDSIKPIRGRDPEVRPLADRRRTWFNIRVEAAAEIGEEDVVIRLYRTDIVRYRHNGEIVVCFEGWDTVTTRSALSAILGLYLLRQYKRTWFGEYEGKDLYMAWRVMDVKGGSNVLVRHESGVGFKLVNPLPTIVHRVNREGSKRVMDRYKPFLTYATNMLKLFEGDAVLPNGLSRARGAKWYEMAWALDEDKYADLFENVCSNVVWVKDVMPLIKDAIRVRHRDEVFEERVITSGAMAKDNYGSYFP